jgi:hypothetical protein
MNPKGNHLNGMLQFSVVLLASLAALSASAATLYVDVNNATPSAPYSTWATAATNIQDAVDVADAGDEVAVTNGVYQSGLRVWPSGEWTNRLAVTKPLNVYSLNGPDVTIIDGGGEIRCVYLAADATLTGFTLTNGYGVKGGGLYCESNSAAVFDCVITRNYIDDAGAFGAGVLGAGTYGGTLTKCMLNLNIADYGIGGGAAYATLNDCLLSTNYGSGAYQCTLNDCTLEANSDGNNGSAAGGGARNCTLNNCSVIGNFAYYGGGAVDCTLNNCSLKDNWGDTDVGGAWGGTLNNCTLTGNGADRTGGGAKAATLNNCIITHNWAGSFGGGTANCTVNNCVLNNNVASGYSVAGYSGFGGGAWGGTLNNCTLIGNKSGYGSGGGAYGATLNNCIVYFNTAPQDPNFGTNCILNYCCTTPMPTNGIGNFTDDPLFVDLAFGDLHLLPHSPCINAGNNSYTTNSTDLDGNARILGGTVDVGAYEFVLPAHLFSSRLSGTNYCFSFDTESNRTYVIEYKNALTDPDWNSYPHIIGNGKMFTVTNSVGDIPQRFYRLRVQ